LRLSSNWQDSGVDNLQGANSIPPRRWNRYATLEKSLHIRVQIPSAAFRPVAKRKALRNHSERWRFNSSLAGLPQLRTYCTSNRCQTTLSCGN